MPFNFDLSGRKELQKQVLESNLRNDEMQREVLKRKLYPEQYVAETAEKLYNTSDPLQRAVLVNTLGETTGTRTIPGTTLTVPAGMGEEAEVAALDNAMNKLAYLQQRAEAEPDPFKKGILQQVANAGVKNIVAKGKEATATDTTFEMNADAFTRFANDLEKTVQDFGNFESYNPEGSAKLRQLNYQMAIAYAKIVDPSSVAREGEVAAAQKYIVPMSRFPVPTPVDTPISVQNATTMAAIRNMQNDIKARIKAYERISGRKLGIDENSGSDVATPQSSPAATGQPQQSGQSTFQYDPRARRLIPGR